jgi:AraC-like DNA-binding protein
MLVILRHAAYTPNLLMAINSRKYAAPRAMVSLPLVKAGHVRAGPIHALGKIVRSLGGDADAIFRAAKIDEHFLGDPDSVLPIAVRGELMERATRETGCEHFGLVLGGRSGIRELGALRGLMLKCSSVGEALDALTTFWLLHNSATLTFIRRSDGHATLGYAVMDGNIPGMPQLQDGAMAVSLNVMREMLGASWRPTGVNLMRREPRDPGPYANFFGVRCRFNATHSELVFPADTLDFRLKNSDTKLAGPAPAPIDDDDWSTYVQRLAYRLLLQGECSQIRVAAALGISSRTLVRKLGNSGMSYQQLFEGVRYSAGRSLIRETNLAFAEIAAALGYKEASSFTRAFQRWTGMSPARWRTLKVEQARLQLDANT